MFQKILAPVDLEEQSTVSVQYAGFFARAFGSDVVLMYADEVASLFGGYDPQFVSFHIPASDEVARQEDALRKLAARHLSGIAVPGVVAVPGPAVASILDVANENRADLIVMGNHSGPAWRRALTGSVAAGVVRSAARPVLVTPPASYPDEIRRVVCPVNFTAASRDALDVAANIAAKFAAELLLVHVHESGGIDSENVHDHFRSYVAEEMRARCRIRELVLRGGAADRVLECVEGQSAQLLVMGTQRKTLRSETIIGTTSERLLRYSPVPVLSITRAAVVRRVEEMELVTAS